MPVVTDPAEVRKDLALATLSAIIHARNPEIGAILKAVTTVLREMPHTVTDPIIELVAQGMGTYPAAELWRNLVAVDLSFYKSPLSQELRAEGRAEGRAEDILFILERRGIDVPDEARERITTCHDLDILHRWLDRALTAASVDEILTDE